MRLGLKGFIRTLDDFGHPINVTYKGEETHQSCLGGVLTIVVKFFTAMVALKAIGEVFKMDDP